MGLLEKIFGNYSEKEIKKIKPIVSKIEALGPEYEKLSDEELRGKTQEFKDRLAKGETLDDILPEAYAVVFRSPSASVTCTMRYCRPCRLSSCAEITGALDDAAASVFVHSAPDSPPSYDSAAARSSMPPVAVFPLRLSSGRAEDNSTVFTSASVISSK